jgi:hypothetical protein
LVAEATLPVQSTATHSDVDAQEMLAGSPPGSTEKAPDQ